MKNPLKFWLGSLTVALLALTPSVVPVRGSVAPASAEVAGTGRCAQTVSNANLVAVSDSVTNECVLTFSGSNNGNDVTRTWTPPSGVSKVRVLVVGGGGAGGGDEGGGGGAGLFIERTDFAVASNAIDVQVGAGGTGTVSFGDNGGDSRFGTLVATGGGGGGEADQDQAADRVGRNGGSGGGGAGETIDGRQYFGTGGVARNATNSTPDGVNEFGMNGASGSATANRGGGGGGAGGFGISGGSGGTGGIGKTSSISGSTITYAAGGGGGRGNSSGPGALGSTSGGAGGSGIGGSGGDANNDATDGSDGTGSGGGGSGSSNGFIGGDGGDGVVIVRYSQVPETPANVSISSLDGGARLTYDTITYWGGGTLDLQYRVDSGNGFGSWTSLGENDGSTDIALVNGTLYDVELRSTNSLGNASSSVTGLAVIPSSVGEILRLDGTNPASYGGSGSTWTDISGESNDGTISGATWDARSKSLAFDGVNDVVTLPTLTYDFSGGFAFHVVVDFGTTSPAWEKLVEIGASSDNDYISFMRQNQTDKLEIQMRSNGGSAFTCASDGGEIIPGFHTYAVVVQSNGSCEFYVDGVDAGTPTNNGATFSLPVAEMNASFVGKSSIGADNFTNGSIQSVVIYNTAQTIPVCKPSEVSVTGLSPVGEDGVPYTGLSFTTAGSCLWTAPAGVSSATYLVAGGGGGGGGHIAGGGGGGEVITGTKGDVSPGTTYTVVVGVGGLGGTREYDNAADNVSTSNGHGSSGSDSSVFGQTATGGGGGRTLTSGHLGGSGGASGDGNAGGAGTSGNPNCYQALGGGGGGSAAVGTGANSSTQSAGNGGAGTLGNILDASTAYGGGGGGGINGGGAFTPCASSGSTGSGGAGGGGAGGTKTSSVTNADTAGQAGLANTGGGGGGATGNSTNSASERSGGHGGSGIVVVRYSLAPGAPTSLAATAGTGQVALTWSASSHTGGNAISDYVVEYQESGAGSWSTFSDGTSTSASATVTGLTNGTTYNFRVKAVNSSGTGEATTSVQATPVSTADSYLSFDGSDDYAFYDGSIFSAQNRFTVEAWVYDEASTSGTRGILRWGADTTNRVLLNVVKTSTTNALQLAVNGSAIIDSDIEFPQNEWVHVALVRVDSTWNLYVNGYLADTGTQATTAMSEDLWVGTSNVATSSDRWKGRIDQVKIWDYSMTQDNIRSSMHSHDEGNVSGGANAPDIVVHYDFNAPSASTLNDIEGGKNLTLSGSIATSAFADVVETSLDSGDRVAIFPRSYLTAFGGWTVPAAASTHEYLVVGGGASGGRGQCGVHWGHGGGGGGVAIGSGTGLSGVKAVTVGVGGLQGTSPCDASTNSGQGTNGTSSVFNAITATGGSAGVYNQPTGGTSGTPTSGGTANGGGTVSGTFSGCGVSNNYCFAGGGGGAGGAGSGLNAGQGRSSDITGDPVVYGSGGAGRNDNGFGTTAAGGGGASNPSGTNPGSGGSDAIGTSFASTIMWGSGANGIVVVRYEVLAVPTISSHPANTTIQSGANGSLSVTASPAATYQWQVSTNGGNTWADVSSATSSTLSLTAVTTSMNNNQYRVIVTNSNDGGETTTATSNAAILTVEDGVTVTGAVCDGSYTKNGLTVDSGHGTVFYIDTGQGQEIDAGYIAYIVESANARNDLWVEVTNFTGGVVSLANVNASALPLGAITAGGSDTAFFMIKASGATTTAQSHIVNVYSQKPTIGNPQPLYSCGYTFVEVAETIKAAANKVESITSTTATRIGSTMTITVQGDSGTIGQGNDIDGRMIWVTPAARSDWPTDALRLESTSLTLFSDRNRRTQISTHTDTLRVNASTGLQSTNRQYYTATYTFRIIGSAASTAPIIPIAMISSGTQVKHTDVGSLPTGGTSVVDLRSPTIDLTVTKNVNPSTVVNSDGTTTLSYTITLTNGGSDILIIDEVIDTPDTLLTFKTGTARFNGAAINDPGSTGTSSLAFSGPLTLPANSARTITYDMSVRTCSVGSTYSFDNIATARTGTVVIGSGSATQSAVNIAGNCGQPTATVTVTNVLVDPVPVTSVASSVTTTTATISGTVDPNSQSGLDVRFRYGTNSNMSSSTDVALADTTIADAPYGVSTNLTGLSGATTYYYVLDIEDPDGGWISGTTRSFTTGPVPSQVSVTTTTPSSLTTTTAVLNGTVDADGVTGGAKVKFEWAESASSSSCSTLSNNQFTGFLQSEDGSGGTEDAILTGFSGVPMSYALTGLTANTNYCYQVVAYSGSTYSSPTTGSPGWVVFTSTSKTAQTISWSTSSNPLPAGGTTTVTATATSALAVTYTSADTNICTVDSDGDVSAVANSGTCSITATQAGDSTYYAAIPVTTTFAIIPPVVTPATLVAGTYQTSGYTQTLRATGGDGTYGTWAVSSGSLPGGLTLNSSTGVISGSPTAAGVFAFSVTTVSNSVTSAAQPFTISIAKRVVTVTASSPSVVFGGAAPSVTPTYSGFIGSDQTTVSTSPNVAPSCTSTYVVGQNVGTSATTSCSGGTHANYTYTYATGTATVTKFPVTITAIDAAKQNIVDGSNTQVTADPTLRWTATSPLPAGQTMADVVPGGVSIARAQAGTALGVVATAGLPAGEQAGSFVITPSGAAGINYEVTYVNGSFTIQTPKEVPTLVVTNKTMTYGDSTTASSFIAGTASNRANGSVAGTFVYTYVDGDGVTQTLTSLSGLGAGTYLVSVKFTPTDTTAYYHDADSPLTETMVLTIERKSVTVTAADKKKLIGALDPALTWSGTGYLGSDGDADLAPVTITRGAGETEGSYAITTTGGSTPNYVVTHVPGDFYIYEPVITVTERAGVLTNRTVQANCRGLKPGTTANFILTTGGSDNPLATSTVGSDGTCPMSSTLTSSVPQGVHTLKITGTDPLDGAVSKTRTIILLSDRIQVITNNSGGGGSGGGGNSSGGTPPLLSTPLSLVTGQPGVRRPTVPPGLAVPPATAQTPPANTETPSGPATRLVPTLPGAPRGVAPGLPGGANATLDLGSGVVSADQPASGSNDGAGTSAEGVRSVQELANERLGGFAPGVGTRIEVLGARTGARFVVTEANQVDSFTLIRAIQASIPAQSADFFALDDVRPAVAPQIPPVWVDEEREGIAEFFAASGLSAPVSLADLDTSGFGEWIQVTGSAETYLPGSIVYLTLTSEPLVLASAEVASDGSVLVTGSLPVEWLSAGEHRVRLVGIRELDGVSVDDEGEVQLSDELMAEIQRFDLGTQSTIAVMGPNLTGGDHVALRVVPLVPEAPWWTLWFILMGFLLVVLARWRGLLKTRGRHLIGSLVVLASAVPAVIIGWLSTVTTVVWWALGLGLIASVLSWFAPVSTKARRAKN